MTVSPTARLDNHGISLDFMDAGVYDHHQVGRLPRLSLCLVTALH